VVLDDANRIRFANARARRSSNQRDLGRAFANLVRQPEVIRYLEAGILRGRSCRRNARGAT
jgi:hypothetical protein